MASKFIIIFAAFATLAQGSPFASSSLETSSNVQLAYEKSIGAWMKAVSIAFESMKGKTSSDAGAAYEAALAEGAQPYLRINSANDAEQEEIWAIVKTLAATVFKAIALIEPKSTRTISTTLYEIQAIESTINYGNIVTAVLKPKKEVSEDLKRRAFASMQEIFTNIFDAIKSEAAVAAQTLSHVDPSLKLRTIAAIEAFTQTIYASSEHLQAYPQSVNA